MCYKKKHKPILKARKNILFSFTKKQICLLFIHYSVVNNNNLLIYKRLYWLKKVNTYSVIDIDIL